jgi:hypothetical protein
VPTLAEAGFPKPTSFDWVGLAAKAGTPPAVIARLNAATDKALKEPKVIEALAKIGSETPGGTPEQLGELVRSQVALWARSSRTLCLSCSDALLIVPQLLDFGSAVRAPIVVCRPLDWRKSAQRLSHTRAPTPGDEKRLSDTLDLNLVTTLP